ncbi:hypothetical protein K437DRAFT_271396 [Tilletiaria anomala UBC 951]|uniref:Uncharacterized protein n=1 Tax=Tilletiaria anomala (strain ATCC 24038 / CBS 436.72 / UBC 951) TaxID=1037660 RepID=A0A066V8E4_TILAU|nr:uncharacterized protein K437DRAFT_271396 [Tilletiaria anomala UBC 951]KDN34840.1 hypothetical protein K437DRAFT_271396 [Tilletiaria anomala UBC 951]
MFALPQGTSHTNKLKDSTGIKLNNSDTMKEVPKGEYGPIRVKTDEGNVNQTRSGRAPAPSTRRKGYNYFW